MNQPILPFRLGSLLTAAALLAGCAGMGGGGAAGGTSAQQASPQRAPIRVLMVTATHGPRSAEAIAASKLAMKELERSTELRVDTTENVGDLNPQKLAAYDVLFLSNASLRDVPPDTTPPSVTYDIVRGGRAGTLVLTGRPGSMTGYLTTAGSNGTTPLQDIVLTGSELSFTTPAGNNAKVPYRATLRGDALEGTTTSAFAGTTTWTGTRKPGPPPSSTSYVPVNDAQKQAIAGFVRGGKGLVVAHAGLDAFPGWPGYREMLGGGGVMERPWTQEVRVTVEDRQNPANAHLGESFTIRDEIYRLDENPRWNSHVLLSLDLASLGVTGHADATIDDYPISWIRPYGQGRVFATMLGGMADEWRTPAFQQHLLEGVRQAAGRVPTANIGEHRVKEVLADSVWPDDIAVDDQGNVWIAELTGNIFRYDAATRQTRLVATVPTTDPTNIEHGIYGVEVDPNFDRGEPWVYVYRAEPESFINTLSRYRYQNGRLELGSEQVLLRVPVEPTCCHQAGDLEWGPNGTLFVSTGDNSQSSTRPGDEIDSLRVVAFQERNGLKGYSYSRQADSERSSQNLQDLRGKILRINKDGTIPKDNPFFGQPGVRWEIWAYGLRNPYRIKWDQPTSQLFIGIVGPDESTTYDWFDIAKGGENFGWPRATGKLFYNEWTPGMIPGYAPPSWEYTYAGGARAAMSGPIYRSTGRNAFPQLQGKQLIYDNSRKWIKYGDVAPGAWESDTVASTRRDGQQFRIPTQRLTNVKAFDRLLDTSPISMEVDPNGCIVVAEFDGFWRPGPEGKANVSRYCWVR